MEKYVHDLARIREVVTLMQNASPQTRRSFDPRDLDSV